MSDFVAKVIAHLIFCVYVLVWIGIPAALVCYFDFFGAASKPFAEAFITAGFTISVATMISILFDRVCDSALAYCRRRKTGAS